MGIENIKNLIKEGYLNDALIKINNLESDQLYGKILYCQILNLQGKSVQALRIIEKLIINVVDNKSKILEFDAKIIQSDILRSMGMNEESLTTLDSCENLLNRLPDKESDDIKESIGEFLISRAKSYQEFGDLNQAINLYSEAASIKQDINDNLSLASCFNSLGVLYIRKGSLNLAIDFQSKALTLFQKLHNQHGIASSLTNLGIIYSQQGDVSTALQMYEKSLEIFNNLGQKQKIAQVYNSMGNTYKSSFKLDLALHYYTQAQAIFENMGDDRNTAIILNNIGLIYKIQGKLEQALDYHKTSMTVFEELEEQDNIAMCYNNIGVILENKGELHSALQYYLKTLEIYEKHGNQLGIGRAMENIGNTLKLQSKNTEALHYLEKSLEIRSHLENNLEQAISLYSLVLLTISMGSEDIAKRYYNQLCKIEVIAENMMITMYKKISNGLILMHNKRLIQKAKAMEIFYDIVEKNDIIDHDLLIFSIMNLCELLMIELRALEENEVLVEIQKLIRKVYNIAEEHDSTKLMVETLILQSNFALIKGDGTDAYNLLDLASKQADDKGLDNLRNKIKEERDGLTARMEKFKNFVDNNERLQAIIQEDSLIEYMKTVSKLRDRGVRA